SNQATATAHATQTASLSLKNGRASCRESANIAGAISYSNTNTNTGNVTISSPSVSDDNTTGAPVYATGDTNSDGKLQVTETWTFTASHTVTQADLDAGTVTNNATGHGTFNASPVTSNPATKTAHATQTASLSL